MNKNDAPTMKDVARQAGVSLGTVSKVVNGIAVGESYRRRVEAAMKKLDYQVNSYARGLKTNKTNCVALVMPSMRHSFFATLTDELTNSLMQRGYRAQLIITNFDSVAENACFTLARQNKIDGIIALSYSRDLDVDESIHVVTIDRHFTRTISCVSSDNYQGGQLAAEKLIALGCKRLLYLRRGTILHGEVEKRGLGFENACHTAGIRQESLILNDADSEQTFFEFLGNHLRDGKLEFDGIFCNSDGLAIQVREYLESQNIRVPQDVQLIGYDGIIDSATGRYRCSTIVQPIVEMAETAVNILLSGGPVPLPASIALPVCYAYGGTTTA